MQLVKEQILVELNRADQNKTVRIDTLHPMDVCVTDGGFYYVVLNDVSADRYVRCWDFDMKAVVMLISNLLVTQVPAKVVVTEQSV